MAASVNSSLAIAKLRYPAPLIAPATIGVTAPSSGISPVHAARFEHVVAGFRERGLTVREGECLRGGRHHVSASAPARAEDFTRLWEDDSVHAIIPPWGGEFLISILPWLDFERLAKTARPKWVLGYSDISTLLFALTLRTGIATAHGSNFMDLLVDQVENVTEHTLRALSYQVGESFGQSSFARYQRKWPDFAAHPLAPFRLTEAVHWKSLDGAAELAMRGRLIGGCIDTLMHLVGTPYGDLPRFVRVHRDPGVILFLENCELAAPTLNRALWQMRLGGWFENLSGIVFGRSAAAVKLAPNPPVAPHPDAYTERDAIADALGGLGMPVILDADIGHLPPQLTLLNGAIAEIELDQGRGSITQQLL